MKIFTYLFTVFGAILMLFSTVLLYPWYISQIDSSMLMLLWFMGVAGILFIHHRTDIAEKLFRISAIGHSLIILLYAIVKFEYVGQFYFLISLLIISYTCFLYSSHLLLNMSKVQTNNFNEKIEIKNFAFLTSSIALIATIAYFTISKPFTTGFNLPYLFLFILSPVTTLTVLTIYRKRELAAKLLIVISFLEIFTWLSVNPFPDTGVIGGIGLFLLARASLAFIAGVSILLSIRKNNH